MPRTALTRAILVFVLSTISAAHASKCFTVGQLSGVSSLRGNGFQVDKDGFVNQTFQILVNGKMSIAPDWDSPCTETAKNTVMCVRSDGATSTVEMWAVDEPTKAVLFNRIRTGFDSFDGAMLFSGKLLGNCNLSAPKASR